MKKSEQSWQDGMIFLSQERRKGYEVVAQKGDKTIRYRVRILSMLVITVITVLVTRLFSLQILEGNRQLLFAENNHVELVRETAPRGIIFDRRQEPLVKNVMIKDTKEKDVLSREYLGGAAMAPVLGYLSQVKESELGCREGLCYEGGSQVGRAGIEKIFEATLRGRDGGRMVELDAGGNELRDLGQTSASAGSPVTLTIDNNLQLAMYAALKGRLGAAVALDMQGRVLGLVSSPSYDPNWFTVLNEPKLLTNALQDKDKQYFLNRASGGAYAPGSVFKPVLAYAGLMTGAITPDTLIEDTGEIKIDQYRYGNWYFDQYGRKEGQINVMRALARSNDIYFYRLGEKLGVDEIDKWAAKFGIGESTGIELLGEVNGFLPTPLQKERRTGEKWFTGNTYHLSIGQGDLTATPLQIARMALGVVSGRKCKLSIVKNSEVSCEGIGLSSEAQKTVLEGMRQACATGGTAFPFFEFEPPVLCKTGTAQHAGQVGQGETVKPHAWIMVGYPAENPSMVLVVFLDSAGEGSYEAGPVAKEILTKWKEIEK